MLRVSATAFVLSVVCFCSVVVTYDMSEEEIIPEPRVEVQDIKATPQQTKHYEEQKQPKKINDGYTQTITKSAGVNYYAGRKETYYSSRVLRHKNICQWWCDSNGFWRASEGYFVVSSSDYKQGTVINISLGQAKVLDCGCASGVVDIYVNW